ncbi:MAG: hypothetical protein BWZ02_01832 [Lentisphaerae bacterium ADurb.BinA184]|nr:MAG: hypothetical protein BWZ02_01832 [Lentisphaerae bacterium ADurb.BinA184]
MLAEIVMAPPAVLLKVTSSTPPSVKAALSSFQLRLPVSQLPSVLLHTSEVAEAPCPATNATNASTAATAACRVILIVVLLSLGEPCLLIRTQDLTKLFMERLLTLLLRERGSGMPTLAGIGQIYTPGRPPANDGERILALSS